MILLLMMTMMTMIIMVTFRFRELESCGSDGKESACNAGDTGLIFGSGRSSGKGKKKKTGTCLSLWVAQMVKNLPVMQETWV